MRVTKLSCHELKPVPSDMERGGKNKFSRREYDVNLVFYCLTVFSYLKQWFLYQMPRKLALVKNEMSRGQGPKFTKAGLKGAGSHQRCMAGPLEQP